MQAVKTVGQQHVLDFKRPVSRRVQILLGIIGTILFLVTWEVIANLNGKPRLFPSPSAVITALYELLAHQEFIKDIWSSFKRIAISFTIAAAISLPLGLFMGAFAPIRAFLGPLVSSSRYLPATAFVPLFLMWFGAGEEQKIALLTVGVVFFLVTLIIDNTMKVPADLIDTSRTLGGNRRQVLLTVIVPACLPAYVDTLRQMLAIGWTYLVVAEIVAATDGIGAMMMRAKRFVRIDDIMAGILVIGILGLLLDLSFRLLHRYSFPYLHQKS